MNLRRLWQKDRAPYVTVDAGVSLWDWAAGFDVEWNRSEATCHVRLGPALVVVWWWRPR